MPEPGKQERFSQALSEAVYTAAWRFCCRLSTCREDAEDLLQEALAKACERFDQLRDQDKFKGWLLCIVRRCYLMQLRALRRRPVMP